MAEMTAVSYLLPSFFDVSMLSSHLWLGLPSGLFDSGFLSKVLCAVLLSPISATYHTQLIFIDLVTIIVIFDEKYKQ